MPKSKKKCPKKQQKAKKQLKKQLYRVKSLNKQKMQGSVQDNLISIPWSRKASKKRKSEQPMGDRMLRSQKSSKKQEKSSLQIPKAQLQELLTLMETQWTMMLDPPCRLEDDDGFDEKLTVSMLIPAACEATINHGASSECHVINDIAFNGNGETLLVATGNCQLKLLDRQGKQWCETIRGDQYLVDLSNTKGHTAAVNACCWNPLVKSEFLTCSDDGTLRIWDTGDFKSITKCINQQRKVIKTKNASGKPGCDDGSIQIWKNGKMFVNTTYLNRNAHRGALTSLQFSPDGKRILSRSMDDTLKLFDLKNFKEPLKCVSNLENMFIQTDCGYSPHAEFVFTGTSSKTKTGESGSLLFFDSESLELLYKIEYPTQGCIRTIWHPKINQLLCSGALLCAERPVKRSRQSEIVREELILSPLTLEMFQPRGEEGEERKSLNGE
uniref:Uncharacterized protein n=1 Tax=Ditylenchus dipsaci TaxID=166011 RepID=A0A915D5I3_9BILA